MAKFNELNSKTSRELLRLNLQHFAEAGDSTETQEVPETTETETPTPDETTQTKPEKTLTQTEFNEALEKRLARERSKFADYDKLKKIADDYEAEKLKMEREKLSETERLQADLDTAQTAKEELEAKLEAIEKAAQEQRIKDVFAKKAREAEIVQTDIATRLVDLSALELDEDGEIEGLDEAINALLTEYPVLKVDPSKPKIIGGRSDAGDDRPEKTLQQQLEEAKQARDFNKVVELSNRISKL